MIDIVPGDSFKTIDRVKHYVLLVVSKYYTSNVTKVSFGSTVFSHDAASASFMTPFVMMTLMSMFMMAMVTVMVWIMVRSIVLVLNVNLNRGSIFNQSEIPFVIVLRYLVHYSINYLGFEP